MESGVVPILDLRWLLESRKNKALENAKWFWNVSQQPHWDAKIRDDFESISWLNLFYWAGWREE